MFMSHFNINSDDEAHLDQHGFDLNYVRADSTRITLLETDVIALYFVI